MKRLLTLCICMYIWSCYSNSMQQKANIPAINQLILEDGVISFITPGKKEFELDVERMDSRHLEGSGRMRKSNDSEWENFTGIVPIDSVDILCFSETGYGKSLLINGVVLTLLAKGMQSSGGSENPTIQIVYPPRPTGPGPGPVSCPFIYSWQGDQYVLEGEAIGVALGKAREMTTSTVLAELNSDGQDLKVRISNERPETHFINTITLQAVEIDQEASILADNDQNLWPVYTQKKPISAIDKTGKDISALICDKDNLFWKSDFEHPTGFSEFEDLIELTFNRPQELQQASLIIRAINTNFLYLVFEKLFEFLGDHSLSFMHAIENDEEVIQLLHEWTIASSLKASFWNGSSWQPCGILYLEANVTPFSRLIRINIPPAAGNVVKLRLTTLADVWEIDAVSMDWTEVIKLDKMAVPLLSVEGQLSASQVGLIDEKDDQYAILLPSQNIDLTYANRRAPAGYKFCYALDVGGYLYEWFPEKNGTSLFSDFGGFINNDRIGFVKYLLKRKDLLLPPLYAEWLRGQNDIK